MRVLFCRRNFWGPASGGDHQIVNYAAVLHAAGHDPSVLVKYSATNNDPFSFQLGNHHVPVRVVACHPLFRAVQAARRVVKWCMPWRYKVPKNTIPGLRPPRYDAPKEEWDKHSAQLILGHHWDEATAMALTYRYFIHRLRPDLIQLIDVWENLEPIRAAHAAGIPLLYQEIRAPKDTPKARPSDYDYDWTMNIWYNALAELLPLCAGVVTLSPRLAELFRERLGYRGPIHIIPLLVEGPARVRERTPSPSGEVTFAFAARLERLKGPLVLLDAWARLVKDYPRAVVKLAGTGSDEKEIQDHAAALGIADCCLFPGAYTGADAKTAFMEDLDVFVLPSFTEGTPLSIIEAMAHGRPVVSTTVGGIPDVVTPDCGILVPPGDSEALADALRRLAGDPDLRAQMGRAARQRYQQLFSPEAVMPLLLDVYRQVQRKGANDVPAARPSLHPWAPALARV